MISYDDLLGKEVNWKVLKQVAKRGNLEYNTDSRNKDWFILSYYIGVINELKDYQAKSFASELTLFLTGEMFPSGVELMYREERMDTHLQGVFEQLKLLYNIDSREFWTAFKKYLLTFYRNGESWAFEMSIHKLNINLNDNELLLLNSMGCKSYRYAVRQLLQEYDYSLEESVIPSDREKGVMFTSAYLGVSERELLDRVQVFEEDTKKFLQIFYYHFNRRND